MIDFFIFISGPLARFVLLPLLVVVIGTCVKYTCQNDKYARFNREFFYWGPSLCVSGLLALIVDYGNNIRNMLDRRTNNDYISAFSGPEFMSYSSKILILVLICAFFMFVISIIIRKSGWIESETGCRHSWWGGIIWPNLLGLALLLIIYMVAG